MSADSTVDFLRERSRLSPLVLDRSHSHGTADHLQGSSSSSSNLHVKREKIIMEMGDFHDDPDYIVRPPPLPPSLAVAHATQGRLHLQQSSDSPQRPPMPHHITSIHPNRVMGLTSTLRLRRKTRNKSDDFCMRTQSNEHEWDDQRQGAPLEKKPLGEFLNELKAESNSDLIHVEEHHTHFNYQRSSKQPTSTNEFVNAKENGNKSATVTETPNGESQDHPPNQTHLKMVTNGEDLSGCLSCDTCFPGGKLTIVPIMDSRDYTGIPPKERDYTGSNTPAPKSAKSGNHSFISWFRSKKKSQNGKHEMPVVNQQNTIPNASIRGQHTKVEQANAPPEENHKNMQVAMEFMKEEVSQANKKRDDALAEVFQLKKAIEEMGKKLGQLENHYKSFDVPSKRISNLMLAKGNREDLDGMGNKEDEYELPRISSYRGQVAPTCFCPTKREFCHAVVEARVGVKQFCRTLLQQLREQSALDKIDTMLKAQNLKVNFSVKGGSVSKRVKYLIESLINQAFYEDFENIKYRKSGSHCVLDPRQRPVAFFKTYMGISQVGWSELVSKDSSAYSESFDGFCDQKMNKLVEELLFFWDLEGGWPDELVKAFFVAAKWVWLLHLLAFSFEHPATIFRVCNESHFDPLYMEELPSKDHENGRFKVSSQHFGNGRGSSEHGSPKILAMVMPGFFFNSYEVIRCKVLISTVVR